MLSRKRIFEIIEKGRQSDRLSIAYDILMFVAIIVSIISLMFVEDYPVFKWFEIVTVIIFIIDYFANNYLNGVLRSYPHMLDDFKDFTYYSNCDPRYIGTYPSVTHMLTGNAFDPSLLVGE